MPHSPSFERDIGPLRRRLDDALKGMRAAEAVLLHHSEPDARLTVINFPVEESLLREAVGLLTGWKAQAVALLRSLDAATAAADLQFARLFDGNAGRQSEGVLRRRVHLGHVAPEAIAAELVDLLSISAAVDRMLVEIKPVLLEHHHNCETYLLRLVARRRQMDLDLENASRQIAALKTRTDERRMIDTSHRNSASEAASEDERRTLSLARQAAQSAYETMQSERETLQRMIADDEDFVQALNGGIAAVNVLAVKLAVDIEQRIALLKAIDVQLPRPMPMGELAAPVQALMAAFDANILAGHDLLARKQRADEAFSRRLEDVPLPDETPMEAEGEPETTPAVPPSSI